MRIRFTATVKDKLPTMGRRAEERLGQVVRKTALDIEAAAKLRCPVDTGACRASIHSVTDRTNGYSAAAAATKAANGGAEVFPAERPEGPMQAIVAVAAAHGIYVEMGTTRMPARPYVTPAFEQAAEPFRKALAAAVSEE